MRHWRVTIKENWRQEPVTAEYVGDLNKAEVLAFFGAFENDVEWFRIVEVKS